MPFSSPLALRMSMCLGALLAAGCCPGKTAADAAPTPSAPVSPSAAAPAEASSPKPPPAPSAPAFQLAPPADPAAPVVDWVATVGCRLLAGDAVLFACLEGGEPDMGFTTVTLRVRSVADAAEVRSFVVYDGPTDLDVAKVRLDGANAYLRKGGFTMKDLAPPPAASVEEGQLVVGEASAPLPTMPTVAPTDALEAKIADCCRWEVREVVKFAEVDTTLVQLVRPCTFGRPDSAAPEACRDPDYNEENEGEPAIFVPVK